MAVATLDFETEYWKIVNRVTSQRNQRLAAPVVKIYDGNWVLRGQAGQIYAASFTEIENETGMASFTMPEDYYLSKWIVDHDGRATKNVHVSMEKDGVRWTGRMDRYEIETGSDGKTVVRVIVKHDYEEFKHIIAWANPFLPAEVQFPKLWAWPPAFHRVGGRVHNFEQFMTAFRFSEMVPQNHAVR